MPIQILTLAQGPVSANCYVVLDTESKKSAIIDCSELGLRLKDYIKKMGIEKFDYILLTHGHFDHILATAKVKDYYGGQVVIHENDANCLSSNEQSLAAAFGINLGFSMQADIKVVDADELDFGSTKIKVIHTPGHTPGCVCYQIEDNIFTGDTLFKLNVGRTDFPNGSYPQILSSVKKLANLDGDFKVYPGHEGESTLDFERKHNPYINK